MKNRKNIEAKLTLLHELLTPDRAKDYLNMISNLKGSGDFKFEYEDLIFQLGKLNDPFNEEYTTLLSGLRDKLLRADSESKGSNKSLSTQIKELIAKDDIEEAFKELSLYMEGDKYNEIVMLTARWNDLKSKSRMGIIELEKENLEKNRIRISIIELVDEYIEKPTSTNIKKGKKFSNVNELFEDIQFCSYMRELNDIEERLEWINGKLSWRTLPSQYANHIDEIKEFQEKELTLIKREEVIRELINTEYGNDVAVLIGDLKESYKNRIKHNA